MIGEVPLPLAKQWTDARDFARPPQADIPRLVGRRARGRAVNAREEVLARIAAAHRIAPPPELPVRRHQPGVSDHFRFGDCSAHRAAH